MTGFHSAEFTIASGSAKKGHNRTSLNLQYKALNTLGEILAYYFKNSVNCFNPSFLVKEGTNNKTLDIILFACSRGVGNSWFRGVGPRIRKL